MSMRGEEYESRAWILDTHHTPVPKAVYFSTGNLESSYLKIIGLAYGKMCSKLPCLMVKTMVAP